MSPVGAFRCWLRGGGGGVEAKIRCNLLIILPLFNECMHFTIAGLLLDLMDGDNLRLSQNCVFSTRPRNRRSRLTAKMALWKSLKVDFCLPLRTAVLLRIAIVGLLQPEIISTMCHTHYSTGKILGSCQLASTTRVRNWSALPFSDGY